MSSVLDVGDEAAIASRPTEPRTPVAAVSPIGPLRTSGAVCGAAATESRANAPQSGDVARWCVAHATATNAP